ncbi:ATP-binding cassette domain-containing protein [Flavobacterium sp.]|uniref:ATP-binding cassette domain-containing protein n=1 Tax=Flavobacterium sp. TaxID=239 RepID=UPI0025F1F97C|nr:ATP-binding cassette domain-containing protein [Flavobacterium sp.]
MKKHFLEIDSVQKSFGHQSIISDVYLKCETGDIIGILGRNGCGKSTLLKIIFGIVPADFKFIRIDGVVQLKSEALFKEISYLHQDSFIPGSFSVKKAIHLSIPNEYLQCFYEDEMIQTIQDKKIAHLSGGELRYLEIKLVLTNPSKFVLLDEPYNGLSPLMIEKINQLILDNTSRKGILITDHNYQNVILVATQLTLMKEGKLHYLKDKMELVEKGYLNSGML